MAITLHLETLHDYSRRRNHCAYSASPVAILVPTLPNVAGVGFDYFEIVGKVLKKRLN